MIRCCTRKYLRLCVRSDEYELGSSDDIKSWFKAKAVGLGISSYTPYVFPNFDYDAHAFPIIKALNTTFSEDDWRSDQLSATIKEYVHIGNIISSIENLEKFADKRERKMTR